MSEFGLLLRYSSKSSIAKEKCLATSPLLVARLHLPHAIVLRLQAHEFVLVLFVIWAVADPGRLNFRPTTKPRMLLGPRYRGAHYHADVRLSC